MKRVAIVQSNYIPWKGYFDMINKVDEIILYDDCQFTKRDWRNRNIIKTPKGLKWLTIPVKVKGKYHQKIKDTVISDSSWTKNHWNSIKHNYSKSVFFKDYSDQFEELYLSCTEKYLSEINHRFIVNINKMLDIKTKISWSMNFEINERSDSSSKLLQILKQVGSDIYVSGPSARSYIDLQLFKKENISVEWMNYEKYLNYNQLHPPFEHNVSIIDLIFNTGLEARNYLNSITN